MARMFVVAAVLLSLAACSSSTSTLKGPITEEEAEGRCARVEAHHPFHLFEVREEEPQTTQRWIVCGLCGDKRGTGMTLRVDKNGTEVVTSRRGQANCPPPPTGPVNVLEDPNFHPQAN